MTTEQKQGGKLQKLARSSKSLREKLTGLVILSDLEFDKSLDISPDDIMMPSMQVTDKYVTPFLGSWTPDEIWTLLEQFRVPESLGERGLKDLVLEVDTTDPFVHCVQLFHERKTPDRLLIQLFVRIPTQFNIRQSRAFNDQCEKGHAFMLQSLSEGLYLITIEWMRMQDYRGKFDRPPLPGQLHPGLGVARQINDLLYEAARRRQRDGLMNVPEYFHNACLYAHTGFKFLNPEYEGMFQAMMRCLAEDIKTRGMADVSWAATEGKVVDSNTRARCKWAPEEQVKPISDRMMAYFNSEGYKQLAAQAAAEHAFHIQWDLPPLCFPTTDRAVAEGSARGGRSP